MTAHERPPPDTCESEAAETQLTTIDRPLHMRAQGNLLHHGQQFFRNADNSFFVFEDKQ